jgi:hypothetical protein
MKNKLTIIILSAIYLVSLVIGYSVAGLRKANNNPSTNTHQDNWILVRVDDMTIDHPQLVSVWVMLVSYGPGPQIFFKPLYTSDSTSPEAIALGRLFSVSANRQISTKFYQALDQLNIQRSGLVILDNEGFNAIVTWLGGSPVSAQANASALIIPITSNLPILESPAYHEVCVNLRETVSVSLDRLHWQTVIPNHLMPYPGLDILAETVSKILNSPSPTHCEVLPAS